MLDKSDGMLIEEECRWQSTLQSGIDAPPPIIFLSKNVYHYILIASPRLLTLNQEGFSSRDPALASLNGNLCNREIAFRITYNVAECSTSDNDAKKDIGITTTFY